MLPTAKLLWTLATDTVTTTTTITIHQQAIAWQAQRTMLPPLNCICSAVVCLSPSGEWDRIRKTIRKTDGPMDCSIILCPTTTWREGRHNNNDAGITYCFNRYLMSESHDVGRINSPPSAAPRGGSFIITIISIVHSTPNIGVT